MNGPFAAFKWRALAVDWSVFAGGLATTLVVSLVALFFSLVLGIVFGLFATSRNRFLHIVNRVYVEFIQNTPLVIQVFFWYNGLPYAGIVLPTLIIGFAALSIYHGAYVAEVVRAGIQAIPKGQLEAAYSQGFTYTGAMGHIIFPQAFKIMLPPLTNVACNLVKNSSVLAIIAGGDLMYHADSWSSGNLYYGPAYVVTGILYFCLCFPLTTLSKKLEEKFHSGDVARVTRKPAPAARTAGGAR